MKTVNIGGIEFPQQKVDEVKKELDKLDFIELTTLANDRVLKLPKMDISSIYTQLMRKQKPNSNTITVFAKALITMYQMMQEKEYVDYILANGDDSVLYEYGFMQGRSNFAVLAIEKFAVLPIELKDSYIKGYNNGLEQYKIKNKII